MRSRMVAMRRYIGHSTVDTTNATSTADPRDVPRAGTLSHTVNLIAMIRELANVSKVPVD